MLSVHRLRLGLPGYLILFAPLAFALQRQYWTRKPPSPLVFPPISTDFTLTPEVPLSLSTLNSNSFSGNSFVKQKDFTRNLLEYLRALYAQ
jgi:hypothetical protein